MSLFYSIPLLMDKKTLGPKNIKILEGLNVELGGRDVMLGAFGFVIATGNGSHQGREKWRNEEGLYVV